MAGKVYLVGAGPGDYKLITLKGMECIREADIIVYDRLANPQLLKEAKENCEFIYVGKKSSDHTKTQDEINDIICEEAKKGKIVTRLKGGDPYVFGRGGEEGEYLFDRGIAFEVVPGITSAIGGLCYAGIPITHRECASSFHVITGHLKEGELELEWEALAKVRGTLVFLMGMSNLNAICENLVKNGKPKDTPVAIVNWAARPYQRVGIGTLENIDEVVKREKLSSPSLIVVGEVANLRDKLNFYENKSLFSKNIIVTRARAQSSDLLEKLNCLGANTLELPTIKINEITPNNELDDAINNIEAYKYIIFTSENGVNIFFNRLKEHKCDSRKLYNSKIVAIGKGTAEALENRGVVADIIPERFVGESVVEELRPLLSEDDKILVPRAKEARRLIVDELSKICNVQEIHVYETVHGQGSQEELVEFLDHASEAYITFTSSSTVKNFMSILPENKDEILRKLKIISIGPITSKTIKEYGLEIYKEAEEYTIDGVLCSIINS